MAQVLFFEVFSEKDPHLNAVETVENFAWESCSRDPLLHLREMHNALQFPMFFFFLWLCQRSPECRENWYVKKLGFQRKENKS